MKRSLFIILFLVLGSTGLTFVLGTKGLQFAAMAEEAAEAQMPKTTVATFTAASQDWEQSLRAVGSIRPIQGVLLETEASGLVQSINFENGQLVEAEQLMVQLDIAVEQAQLRSAEATARLAEIEFQRAQRLRESGNVPQSSLDSAIADMERANAEVENIKAVIDRKTIRAPFAGRVGIRQINLGQFVPMGAPLVALQSYGEVFVNFSLPQQALGIVKERYPIVLSTDAFPGREFVGKVTAISPEIDQATRTVRLQGTLLNTDESLRPGLFTRLRVILPESKPVVAVPTTSILYAPYGNSIFRVVTDEETGDLVAKQFFVRLGATRGDFVEVIEGVNPGDQIVSGGAFKLRNNTPVIIDNSRAPEPELYPEPNNS